MPTAFIRSNAELNALLNSWLVKYDPDQPRDPHGRWSASGAQSSAQFRAAAGRTVTHALAAAAALANSLDTVTAISANRGDLLRVAAHAHAIQQHMIELSHHIRETRAGFRELGAATKLKLQTLRDHLANIKDHIQRIKAEQLGDTEHASSLRGRIELRRRAMALR
jgi:hypothetical protein